ncbi:hypothetical protein [Lysinibacillus fusiformis]|uniref:hypothetical protein n=1 Tax=Lysinibacillus fusiformis TaxID=28031 RepID=UPI0021B6BE61|nr:hypothetical protein [Lysinibacillus fusiformis]
MRRFVLLCAMLLVVVGFTIEEKVIMPENGPDFLQENDSTSINWNDKAVEFGDRAIIGNANKSGVIGANMPSLNKQKWMWHLWGIEGNGHTELTVVGYHSDTKTIQPILVDGWSTGLGGTANRADAHSPSSVKIPSPGNGQFYCIQMVNTLIR